MTRNIWHYVKLNIGQVITFEGKKWKVLGQADYGDNKPYHFPKNRYYTKIQAV